MTEKLSEYKITSRDGAFINVECNTKIINTLVRKINELVDVVNDLKFTTNHILEEKESEIKVYEEARDMYDNAILDALKDKQVDVVVEPAENVQDKFAEQCKWIGKLCMFWDEALGEKVWGILGGIDYSENTKYPYWCDQIQEKYQCCKPVKPDNDIIYKGE